MDDEADRVGVVLDGLEARVLAAAQVLHGLRRERVAALLGRARRLEHAVRVGVRGARELGDQRRRLAVAVLGHARRRHHRALALLLLLLRLAAAQEPLLQPAELAEAGATTAAARDRGRGYGNGNGHLLAEGGGGVPRHPQRAPRGGGDQVAAAPVVIRGLAARGRPRRGGRRDHQRRRPLAGLLRLMRQPHRRRLLHVHRRRGRRSVVIRRAARHDTAARAEAALRARSVDWRQVHRLQRAVRCGLVVARLVRHRHPVQEGVRLQNHVVRVLRDAGGPRADPVT